MNTCLFYKSRFTAAIGLAAIFCAQAQSLPPPEYFYHPGLIQAKFSNIANFTTIYNSDVANAANAERVPGPVMADLYATEATFATALYHNAFTGNSWGWDQLHSAFGYVGQMFVEANVTYTFGKNMDDAARIVINGVKVLENTDWKAFGTGSFTTNATGWVDIDIRIWDGSGGKGPFGEEWDRDMGLACNTSGHTQRGPKTSWTKLLDPGDMTLFRTLAQATTPTEPGFVVPPEVTLNGRDFTLSATLWHGQADMYALVGVPKNYTMTNLFASGAVAGTPVSGVLANLTSETMYTVAVLATNNMGETSVAAAGTPFYTGDVTLEFVQNAAEEDLVPGKAVIRRAGTADAMRLPLTVNYTVTGVTAVEGVNYKPPSGKVIIPAGASSAEIIIAPLLDSAGTQDVTLDVALAPGLYYDGSSGAVTITIEKWTPSAEYNTWIAPADGLASDAANWTQGVPQAGHKIKLGTFSSANMTWDAGVDGLTDTVASWSQDEFYTGTVTFTTTYDTTFTVTGDVDIRNGAWTHPANDASQTYRLAVAAGGDFTLGTTAKIDLRRKGYAPNVAPAGGQVGVHAGGRTSWTTTYGNPYTPRDIGAGGTSLRGGGALWLVVTGNATLNGLVRADSEDNTGNTWATLGAGAGGSIYVKAASVSGGGTVTTSAPTTDATGAVPSGGRIAFELTQAQSLALPIANVTAFGATGPDSTGAGTILVKTPGQAYGTLYVKNRGRIDRDGFKRVSPIGTTIIPPGATWTFDQIITSDHGILSIPEGATLKLPGGFASVSGIGNAYCSGIVYEGGTLDFTGYAAPWVFSSNWVFHANAPLTINADVQVINGGAIGLLRFNNDSKTSWTKLDLTINGNLFVDATSWIYARSSGFDYCSPNAPSITGGATTAQVNGHGGQQGNGLNAAYGSIFNPVMPGSSGWLGDRNYCIAGGGVVLLRVSGELRLDGIAESTGDWYNRAPGWNADANVGPGGSINITAGNLSGSGQIRAHGLERSYNEGASANFWGHSGGGRIAIRLTQPGAMFDAFDISKITAKGGSNAMTGNWTNRFSSAGTIYLQDATKGEGGGQIIVRNDNNPLNVVPVTVIPALTYGGLDDDLTNASLLIQDCAIVKLSGSVRMNSAAITPNSRLDLNGHTLTLFRFTSGDQRFSQSGLFTAAQLDGMGFACVIDTSENASGLLEIKPVPTLLLLR